MPALSTAIFQLGRRRLKLVTFFANLAIVLHGAIVRTSSSFRYDPVDILGRILDVAGFAMNAVLRVNLELFISILFNNNFIDTGGTIPLRRLVIERQIRI